ncbi:MAG: ScyD/ScyE family protein [Chloroflexota bacterium]
MHTERIARLAGGLALAAGLVAIPALAAVSPASAQDALPAGAELVASGLDNPRGLAFGPDGVLYVAEAGASGDQNCITGPEGAEECYGRTSGIAKIVDGTVTPLVEGVINRALAGGLRATGLHDVAFGNDGALYAVVGVGGDPAQRAELETGAEPQLGWLFRVDPASGEMTPVADIAGYEGSANPDGEQVDSNPYAISALPGGDLAVVDAGGNFVARVTPDGTISTMAVFPSRTVQLPGPDKKEFPMQAVPDAIATGLDGTLAVGELTGVPFPKGGAMIWSVGEDGNPAPMAEGFTTIIDLAWALDGSLYVLEWTRDGIAAIDPANPKTFEGRLVRIAPNGQQSVIAEEGLVTPAGLAIGSDGMIYVTINGGAPGVGAVVRFPLPADDAAAPAA